MDTLTLLNLSLLTRIWNNVYIEPVFVMTNLYEDPPCYSTLFWVLTRIWSSLQLYKGSIFSPKPFYALLDYSLSLLIIMSRAAHWSRNQQCYLPALLLILLFEYFQCLLLLPFLDLNLPHLLNLTHQKLWPNKTGKKSVR